MSVLVVGLSHRSAPVDLLERVVLPAEAVTKLLADVLASDHATEAFVLSTCNRVEVYAEVDKFHGGLAQASELLARRAGIDLDELTPHLYVHYEDRAVSHLFSVACGLDSMVVGESQVLGQVRVALRTAQDAGTAGRQLGGLAQQALRVGKRARTETGIDRAGRSLVTAGLEVAGQVLGPLDGTEVLVVGAGAMSALAATVVAQGGAARVVVANRTLERAERVAAAVGGEAVPLDSLQAALASADLVVSCTGAVGHVLDTAMLAAAVAGRPDRPLVVLDLALPRDVDPSAHDLPGVTVVDLETLAGALATSEHAADVEATREIVVEEVAAFLGWQRAVSVAPTVVALRDMADSVVRAELVRLTGRLPDLDPHARAEIEQTVTRVVDKLLHAPTVRVKQLAEEPGGQSYADALNKLFGLDPKAVEAVTRADVATDPTPGGAS
ncbi:MAG: glutamyl-tRNA reductase [Actinomycetota bacterium]|nr:glutamyl-tRNA reductase [Actinomycetota bacterium]